MTGSGFGRLVPGIAAFVAAGIPLVAYVWETLNDLLSANAEVRQVLLAIPALALLLLLWRFLARSIERWDRERHPSPAPERIR